MVGHARWRWIAGGVALACALLAYLVWRSGPDAPHRLWERPQVVGHPSSPSSGLPSAARAAGPGGNKNACEMAMVEAFNARAHMLSRRQDARSQLAYALAVPFEPGFDFESSSPEVVQRMIEHRHAEAQRALLHASGLAPDNPEILFLAAAQCGSGEACRKAQQALLAAEPDNMAAWLLEIGWARTRNDPDAGQRALANAAKARRYDLHADTGLRVLVETYGDLALPAACSSEQARAELRRATGLERDFGMLDYALVLANVSRAFPSYSAIRHQCLPQADVEVDKARLSACRTILSRVANGDTLLEQSVGLSTLVELLGDDQEAAAWRQRYRDLQWLRDQSSDSSLHSALDLEDYLLDEVRAIQAALQAAGRWPAPADWLPADPHARSLIQTGRPPPKSTR